MTHEDDGRHDFDFFFGSWTQRNRKLKKRLVGCTEWDEFASTASCFPMLGGLGNIDNLSPADEDDPFEGMSIRIFDPATKLWAIWWADNVGYTIFPPVYGRFVDGIGEFNGEDVQDGIPVDVKFIWSQITPTSAKWEQAFSTDGGETWETNWETFHTRVVE